MDPCIKLAREFKRADRTLAHMPLTESASDKLQAVYDRTTFLLTLTKPESLPGAGDLIHRATRYACGNIPHDMQQSLFFIGARLKKNKPLPDDVITLRQMIMLIKHLPVNDEGRLPIQVSFDDCSPMEAAQKDDIVSMLNNALEFMSRPRLLH